MTPMDRAWDLLKMPLNPDSIRETQGDLSDYGWTHYAADFINPVTGEIEPMEADFRPEKGAFNSLINARIAPNENPIAWSQVVQHENPGPFTAQSLNIPNEAARRKGRGTALYDLIARIIDMNTDSNLQPSNQVKPDGRALWDAQAPEGIWPHDEVRI